MDTNGDTKMLLLKDLCSRLPYGVILDNGIKARSIDILTKIVSGVDTDKKIEDVKYYLRPMSSMTEKEDKEFALLQTEAGNSGFLYPSNAANLMRFLNAHHLDYNGLIEKGLALPAPEGMYE